MQTVLHAVNFSLFIFHLFFFKELKVTCNFLGSAPDNAIFQEETQMPGIACLIKNLWDVSLTCTFKNIFKIKYIINQLY